MDRLRPLREREKVRLALWAGVLFLVLLLGAWPVYRIVDSLEPERVDQIESYEQKVNRLHTQMTELDLGLALFLSTEGREGRTGALTALSHADATLDSIIRQLKVTPWVPVQPFADLRTTLRGYGDIIDRASIGNGDASPGTPVPVNYLGLVADLRQGLTAWLDMLGQEEIRAQSLISGEMTSQTDSQEWLLASVIVGYAVASVVIFFLGVLVLVQKSRIVRFWDSRERYRKIFEDSRAVGLLIDPRSGQIVDANLAASMYYGYSVDQLRKMRIYEINVLTRSEIEQEMAQARAEQRNRFFFRHRLADGTEHDVEVHSSPIEVEGRYLLYSVVHDISQQREAEQALSDTELRYSAVINSSAQGFLMVAPSTGKLLDVNNALCQMLGYDRAAMLGRPFFDFVLPQDHDRTVEQFAKAMVSRHRIYEVRLKTADGSPQQARFYATSLFNKDGEFVGSYAFVDDISKRRESEQRLKESQSRLMVAVRAGNIGVWDYSPITGEVSFSAEWKAQLGYEDNEFPETREAWLEVIHPEDRVHSDRLCRELFEGRYETISLSERYRHRDGHWVYIRSCAMVMRDENGDPRSLVGAHVDLTPQHEIQDSLARANARNVLILDSAADGLLGVDERGRVTMVNVACQHLLGFTANDVIGRNAEEFLHPTRADGTPFGDGETPIRNVLETGTLLSSVAVKVWRRDGVPLAVELGVAPMIWKGAVMGAIISFHDISESLHYREELERSNNELEQFAYMASHDLQEPLRTISSYLTLIRRRYHDALDGDGQEFIDTAVDGANRMNTMIRDLLDYSRVGRRGEDLSPLDSGVIIQEALANLAMTVTDVKATVSVAEMTPQVMGDHHQLVSLFQNLIGNALKYRSADRLPQVDIRVETIGDGLCKFFVTDNGIGIAEECFDRIFVPFQRLHSRTDFEGNGIGLAICRKIVQRHGGEMTVESVEGKGSVFAFTLHMADVKVPVADAVV